MFRHAVRPLLALALALAPALGEAALYRWVDELGVTHYATDLDAIPSSARGDALEIIASPAPVAATRVLPVPPAPPETATEPAPASAPTSPAALTPTEPAAAPPAPTALETPPLLPPPAEPTAAPSTPEPTAPEPMAAPQPAAVPEPTAAPTTAAPATVEPIAAPSEQPDVPGPSASPVLPPGDPRAAEVADLEAKIAADRERLRQMISTKRWDSAELASDPSIREIADRLPRMQAELAALRAETVP